MQYECPCCGTTLEKKFKWSIDLPSSVLFVDKSTIHLSPREAEVLFILRNAAERFIQRNEILYQLSPNQDISPSNVPVLVYRIRKRIINTNLLIESDYLSGYRAIYKGGNT